MKFSTLLAFIGLTLATVLALPAQTVRVIFASGEASIQRPDESSLRPVVKGETVVIGTRIVTGADGRVVLTPMPGVKSIIAPNTVILLESSSETRTSPTEVTHQAVIDLKEGSVVSDLNKPEGVAYDYSIRTARGLAGARGTVFTVGINAAGIQTIVVAHGSITINFIDGSQATLSPGNLAITKANGDTQNVGSLGELSESDQQIAQKWAETTVLEITAAVEARIDINPEALKNALDTAAALGVTLSPETQAAVDKALTQLGDVFKTREEADPLKKVNEVSTKTTQEITTQILAAQDAQSLLLAQLTAEQVAVFNSLPADIQLQIVTLGDVDIARLALSPDPDTGLPITHNDLRVHLTAFDALSDQALAFVKTLAGSNLQSFDDIPDPAAWSPDAFERTLASWNALTSTERNLIVSLGAGESIMDTSASYISALLASLDSTQLSLIEQTGWGDHLAELAGKPTAQNIFSAISELSPAALKAIKFFDISPDVINNYYTDLPALAEALGQLSAANQQILLQLDAVDAMLNSYYGPSSNQLPPTEVTTPDYSAGIANVLNFYGQLTSSEKVAARAIGLGGFLYTYQPSNTVGESGTTALQRVRQLTKFYNDNPGLQQAITESGVLSDSYFTYYSSTFDATFARAALNAYNSMPGRTRDYLLTQDNNISFFSIFYATHSGNDPYIRSIAEISSILSGLTSAEYAILLDLDVSTAIITKGYYGEGITPYFSGAPLAVIKATIDNYAALGRAQKSVLRELGILGEGNIAILGTDTDGLNRLLTAYSSLPGALRAATERLNEYDHHEYSTPTYYGSTSGPVIDRSYFFPAGYDSNTVLHRVKFSSTRDLYVGATRYLRIDGAYWGGYVPVFDVGNNRDLYLHASDLIDLNNTRFSANIRGITMAAHTINLSYIDFPEGSTVSLNSKLGQLNFGSSYNNGKVNFTGVSYGGNPIYGAGDLTSEFGARGNIKIGTLKNPAARPTYTPPAILPP